MGDIECCAWSSFGRSFLRIQPLTWYPKDSGGSLRLGAPQGTHGVLTGYAQRTSRTPAAACASVCSLACAHLSMVGVHRARAQACDGRACAAGGDDCAGGGRFWSGWYSTAPNGRGRPGLRSRSAAQPFVVRLRRLSGRTDGCARGRYPEGYSGSTRAVPEGTEGVRGGADGRVRSRPVSRGVLWEYSGGTRGY